MLIESCQKLPKVAKKFSCKKCHYSSSNKFNFNKHLSSTKHKMLTNANSGFSNTYVCEKCKREYHHISSWSRHKKTCSLHNATKVEKKVYSCEKCEKKYQHHSSYYRHLRKCKAGNMKVKESEGMVDEEKEAMKEELKEMRGMMKQLISATQEMAPKVGNNNISINVFLNEHCKDAMNLVDFVNKIRVSLKDLMNTRELGYVSGISNILIKNLEDLSTRERPIHCSDTKRLKFYIKEDNIWARDNGDKMKKVVKEVAIKQIQTIKKWEQKHPGYLEDENLMSEWRTVVQTTMGGCDMGIRERNEKEICKKVSKNILLKDAIEKV